jgi:RNA polymerase sigma factor (sigma-70 family)
MYDQNLLQLYEAIKDGNSQAFEEFYKLTWYPLYQIAWSKTKDDDEAKDIVQDLYIRLWDKRDHINIQSNPTAYLRAMLRNEIVKRLRAALDLQQKKDLYADSIQDLSDSIEEILLTKELEQRFAREVAKLPPKQKEIYLLYYVSGLSAGEIASNLAIAEQTVKNQLVSAKKKLRTLVEGMALIQILAFLLK